MGSLIVLTHYEIICSLIKEVVKNFCKENLIDTEDN